MMDEKCATGSQGSALIIVGRPFSTSVPISDDGKNVSAVEISGVPSVLIINQ